MNEDNVNKNNFDVVSLSRPGKTKKNYIQDALSHDASKVTKQGGFINHLANMFLKVEAGEKAYR